MRCKKLKLSALLLLGVGLAGVHAQESINASGGNAAGSGGTVSYSLGQVVYTTHTGSGGLVAQGVQLPYEIAVVTAIDDAEGIQISASVYPNPTTDHLILSISEFDISNLVYQLYDMNGRLLQNGVVTGNKTTIYMSDFVPASYFVKVMQGTNEVKTFKVIKH